MPKDYKNKNLDRSRVIPSLEAFSVENITYKAVNASGQHHLRGEYKGTPFLINIFENKDGSTTLGFASGQDRALFEALADELLRCCTYSEVANLELSLPGFSAESLKGLLGFLESEGAGVKEEKDLVHGGHQARWAGPQGDSLIIKTYKNGTVQFQGKNAHLASLLWDSLYNVLSLEDAIAKQSKVYEIVVTVDEIKDELAARVPVAHQLLEETVRKQLSSALMLCKVAAPLEDYSAVAFPALRGLEGFIKQILLKGGLKPADKDHIGDYFDQKVVGSWALRAEYASHVGPVFAPILESSYTLYYKQRHGIFHMDARVEASRILGSLEDARRIVFTVFETIESACQKLCK
jgi:hypothetical protein